jgi:Zn-dependent protease
MCGVDVDMPFRCNYCEHYYCPEHRLPENHDCSETWRVKAVRSARANAPALQQGSEAHSLLLSPRLSTLHFSGTELRHLALGTALVTAAGISFILGNAFTLIGLVLAALIFSMGFILHELAHKYVAQGYGLWAEFRVNATGVILTALSIVSPIKFIAPGAVVISGFAEKERIGRTAISGPIVNVIITVGLLTLLPILRGSFVYAPILFGAGINAFLALFNLIPFSVFDGRKVFYWNRHYWAALFLMSLALTIYSDFVLRPI